MGPVHPLSMYVGPQSDLYTPDHVLFVTMKAQI